MATSVVESGNYELFIDTGFKLDAFTLDSATQGLLNGTQYVLDGTTEFAPILEYSTNVNVRRGRRDTGSYSTTPDASGADGAADGADGADGTADSRSTARALADSPQAVCARQ